MYVDDVADPQFSSEDRHHLHRVLRLRVGDPLVLSDGRGSWCDATFADAPVVTSPLFFMEKPEPALRLSVALPKGDRADWLIQKATEIGIDELVVVQAERSVVRQPTGKSSKPLERLARIARAAGAQSRRVWLPALSGPLDVAEAGTPFGTAIAEPGGGPITPDCRNVLIGPEGGWTDAELASGPPLVGLGPQVLRVETAALVASTLLVALRSRLVLPAGSAPENAPGG
ncbi:MAG: 16S rRNA (uracil(1498)-N(3))-methyltransferase [Acidimicrobiia bacterium]